MQYGQRRTMTTFAIAIGVVASAAIGLAPAAAASPTGGWPATETVDWLHEQGYTVHLNSAPNGPLSQCITTGVHGLRDSNIDTHGRQLDPARHTAVYVDVACNTTA
jgi:hypothetical protein